MENLHRMIDEVIASDWLYRYGWNENLRYALCKSLEDIIDDEINVCEASRYEAYNEFCGAIVFMSNAGYLPGEGVGELLDAGEAILNMANAQDRERMCE